MNPWLFVAAAVAVYGIVTDLKAKGKDSDGNDRKDGGDGSGGNRHHQQSSSNQQHHGEDLGEPARPVFALPDSNTETEQNNNEKVSPDNAAISPVGTSDGGDDRGGEQNPPTADGS